MTWIIDDLEDKVNSIIKDQVHSLEVKNLDCVAWVTNELFETLLTSEFKADGLKKLVFEWFKPQCAPFNNEVMTRLVQACANLNHLQLSLMDELTEEGRGQLA
jgi:hypothetical protein